MKNAILIHNPQAGGTELSKKKLIGLLEDNDFGCRYLSTKAKGWKDFETDADFIVVAGGDGTVRRVIKELLDRTLLETLPIALLPWGTANNIANALGVTGKAEDIIETWKQPVFKKFDLGRLYNIEKEAEFFLEGFGYGIFPYLMQEMSKRERTDEPPDEVLRTVLKLLYEIVSSYEPRQCELEIDGTNHSGRFLFAEAMNTPSIGPNLLLSPLADPGDGELEVILVPEAQKQKFADYIKDHIEKNDFTYQFHTLKGRNIKMSWKGAHVHVDDRIIKLDKTAEVRIEIKAGLLNFIVPPVNDLRVKPWKSSARS
jgi:diacylglycerol kinase (ATP)